MDSIDYEYVAEYCKQHWKGTCDRIVRIADDVCNNTFVFEMPWDMERTVKPTHFDGEIDWNLIVGKDNEYLFQMNRHRYFVVLGQAYRLSGDEKYARRFVELLTDFIRRVPALRDSGNHPWRSLEVGLRAEYWTKAMALFKDAPQITEEVRRMYRHSLQEHAEILIQFHNAHKKLSNWGVIQDHGLFAIGIELKNESYRQIALERLTEQSRLQLFADGTHWEQSCMYHNEVLACFYDVIVRARDNGIEIPEEIVRNAHRMARVDLAWVMPHHRQPLFGDSDYTDLRDVLTLGAYLFGDEELKSQAYDKLDYESAWLLGKRGVEQYAALASRTPAFCSAALYDSGNYIMRSDWSEQAHYLIFHNGYTGAGHAHCDKLSFDLTLFGCDMITDTGRYSYIGSDRTRRITRSAKGHNGLSVDGRDACKCIGWRYIKYAPAIKSQMRIERDYELVSGTHLGYLTSLFPVVLTRKILWIKPDLYVIFDLLDAKGYHTYRQRFNFAPGVTPQCGDTGVRCRKDGVQTELFTVASDARIRKKRGVYSLHYNRKEPIDRVEITYRAAGSRVIATVIAASDDNRNVTVTKKKAEGARGAQSVAFEVVVGNDRYLIFCTSRELMRCVTVEGKAFSGKMAYYRNDVYVPIEW